MKIKRLMALILTVTLLCSVIVFTPAGPAAALDEAGTASLLPVDDAFVSFKEGCADENYGGALTLESGYNAENPPAEDTGTRANDEQLASRGALSYPRDIFMKFDLGNIAPEAVSSAVLKLTLSGDGKNIGWENTQVIAATLAAYAVGDGWSEASITRNNAPEAGELMAISDPLSPYTAKNGAVVELDLTGYIRSNPKKLYSLKLMPSAAGFDFHSKETGTAALRPVLEVKYDSQLASAVYGREPLVEDTYAENMDTSREADFSAAGEIVVATDKASGGDNGASYTREGFIKIRLPEGDRYYDKVKISFRAASHANADQTISAFPTSSNWKGEELCWNNRPAASASAAARAVIPLLDKTNEKAVGLTWFDFDVTDYVNAHPSRDGLYSFALKADTAIGRLYSLETENELSRPYVEYMYREKAAVTVRYIDKNGAVVAGDETLSLPVGRPFTPEFQRQIGDYVYSEAETAARNALPYVIKPGENTVFIVYENKHMNEVDPIELKTVQFIAPELPAEVTVRFDDGSEGSFPVTWTSIEPSLYAEPGEFTAIGTVQGIDAGAVEAKITVLAITSVEMKTISTSPGTAPMLPATVNVTVEDGSERRMNVVWNEIDPAVYADFGYFTAYGALDPGGMPIQITVLVEEGDIDDREAVADTFTALDTPTTPHNEVPSSDAGSETALRLSGTSGDGKANTDRKVFLRFEGGAFGDKVSDKYSGEHGEDNIDAIVNSYIRLHFQRIDNGVDPTFTVYGLDPSIGWDEKTLTWNGSEKLLASAERISSRQVSCKTKEAAVDFDVTGYVREHRDDEYLSFCIEVNTCASYVTDRECATGTREGQAPTLHTTKYVKYAPVTVRYKAGDVEVADPLSVLGKLDKPYSYEGSVPDMIFFPEPKRDGEGNIIEAVDPENIYYYDYVYDWLAAHPEDAPSLDGSVEEKGDPEPDPRLHLDSLAPDGNEVVARYTQRMIKSVEPSLSDGKYFETVEGVRPELPSAVIARLDNGAPIIKAVTWRWDETKAFTDGTVGRVKVYGDVEHAPKDVRAEAEIEIRPASLGEAQAPVEREFGLVPGTTYCFTFTRGAGKDGEIPDYAGKIMYTDGVTSTPVYALMGEMSEDDFLAMLESKAVGETVRLSFTVPELDEEYEGPGQTLVLPETLDFFLDAVISPVTGRGSDLTVHYMLDGEELASKTERRVYGESFGLGVDDFYALDGTLVVTAVAEHDNNAISKLTDSFALTGDAFDIYLSCEKVNEFTVASSVENLTDSGGTPYTRSRAALFNGSDEDKSAEVIVAVYLDDGRLESITRRRVDLPARSAEVTAEEIDVPVADNRSSAIFVWSALDDLKPAAKQVSSLNPLGITPKPQTEDLIVIPAIERSITPSDQQSGNEAVHLLDRTLSTRWSAPTSGAVGSDAEVPATAVIDLGGIYDLHTLGLAFYKGDDRSTGFSVSVSDGDKNGEYLTVVPKRQSSGDTLGIEYFSFDPVPARYVKIDGYGWSGREITDGGLKNVSDNWFSATAFEAYGALSPSAEITPVEEQTFDGGRLGDYDWGSDVLNEMTYTDYSPETGADLYADIAATPKEAGFAEGNTALHLYDNVDRENKGGGAGSIGAFHRLPLPSDNYRISFKWYVPNTVDGKTYNAQWAGVTLSSGRIEGGADTSHPAALQLRLSPSGKNAMTFNVMRSITYNEGSQAALLGSGTAFKANCVWDVMLDVDAASDSVVVTVSDGEKTESAFTRYGLYNDERTMSQTWSNSFVNYIMFNTGAGGKCEMYIDDLAVTPLARSGENEGELLTAYDFNGDGYGEKIVEEKGGLSSALIREDNQAPYTPAYGNMLYADIKNSSATDASLHLYDKVGREQNGGSNGSGGLFAYVDLGDGISAENETLIKFDMYVPKPQGEWAGIALASGKNFGGADQEHPMALQLRFSPQTEGIQLNRNTSIQYNKGSNNAFIGTGNNRLAYNAKWQFEIRLNPVLGTVKVQATDGRTISANTASLPTQGEDKGDGKWTVDWSKTPVDTLIFNTGAGGSNELYIDNIEVRDLGKAKTLLDAVNGIVRLQDAYDTNTANQQWNFVVNANTVNSTLGVTSGVDPFYTRFVERKGLYDPDGVSFELLGQPGCYVVAEGSGNSTSIVVRRYTDTESFRKRATFNKIKHIGKDGDYTYELYSAPGRYLRVDGTAVKTVTNPSDGEKMASSFYLRDESKHYVSDSFNGNSLSGQWHKGYPWYANYHNHSAVHRDENVVVGGGRVLLKATKVADNDWITNSKGQTGYNDSINGNKWKKYCAWTGVISVNNKVYNKGSYIEGSFKQPNSPRGYWTAFWLNGRDSWPPETDMFEYLSSMGTNTWYTATHGGSEGAGWQYSGSVGNMRTQWNTFSIDWGYNYIDMYVNGNLYFSRRGTSDVGVQKNMYLIINTGIGAWESEPNGSTVWNTGLECQWLRSYQYY